MQNSMKNLIIIINVNFALDSLEYFHHADIAEVLVRQQYALEILVSILPLIKLSSL